MAYSVWHRAYGFNSKTYHTPFAIRHLLCAIIFLFILGCVSTPVQKNSPLEKLSHDIQKDKQAQSALESVTGAVISHRIEVYYCPVDGERFSPRVKICPVHQVPLKKVEE